MDLYIYYRARPETTRELQEKVAKVHADLFSSHGITATFKRSAQPKDGQHTWMEVYPAVRSDFTTTLQDAVAQAGLDSLIDGERHTEIFVDVSSCA